MKILFQRKGNKIELVDKKRLIFNIGEEATQILNALTCKTHQFPIEVYAIIR